MALYQNFIIQFQPAIDEILKNPNKQTVSNLLEQLTNYQHKEARLVHESLLFVFVQTLDKVSNENQDVRTGIINCISIVISRIYIKDIKALQTIFVIVRKQIQEFGHSALKPGLSEEIKLAVVECFIKALTRSTTDVIEQFYTKEKSKILAEIILSLVQLIEKEKYKKLIIRSIQCLMTVFYVHDEAEFNDVVLRNQVADMLFLYLPKVIVVLCQRSTSSDTIGETLKSLALKALGRILWIIYDETNSVVVNNRYALDDFKKIAKEVLKKSESESSTIYFSTSNASNLFANMKKGPKFMEIVDKLQANGRTKDWTYSSSLQLRKIFQNLKTLRSHESVIIRTEYAIMCCNLLQHCPNRLKENFMSLLEDAVSLSIDDDEKICSMCQKTLFDLQSCATSEGLFDDNYEVLFDEQMIKLPRVINHAVESELYAELMFLKGFLLYLSDEKLYTLFSMPRNVEVLSMCLLTMAELKVAQNMLTEEYALRRIETMEYYECSKLYWRQYLVLESKRCIGVVVDICGILGSTSGINHIIYDFLIDLLTKHQSMNEIILLLLWMITAGQQENNANREYKLKLATLLMRELLKDEHWHLALQADLEKRLKVAKPSNWFKDSTPGLYESAIEIRTQDIDTDDDDYGDDDYDADDETDVPENYVTINDAKFNVLHTCIVLDALGHTALYLEEEFKPYIFRTLHQVLLKAAHSNAMVYQAAYFALISISKALKCNEIADLISNNIDYIVYHLNTTLKRTTESKSAVEILSVVLQFSDSNALPHLENIFATIREEAAKPCQSENITAYLKVFCSFLSQVSQWQKLSTQAVDNIPKQSEDEIPNNNGETNEKIFENWLAILEINQEPEILIEKRVANEEQIDCSMDKNLDEDEVAPSEEEKNEVPVNIKETEDTDNNVEENCDDIKPPLPQYIEMAKSILEESLKFISSTEKSHQILSLESLIIGLPMLKDYENELLPLVHNIWQPLVEKFHQRDAIVLNRCFTILNTMATYAKSFILKRSLNDVVPFLKRFLEETSEHSAADTTQKTTQEYKLQLKLLKEFPNLIESMEIDGKHLDEIGAVIVLYLSVRQPKEFQFEAIEFFNLLRSYNGPWVYVTVFAKSHLEDYKDNVDKVIARF